MKKKDLPPAQEAPAKKKKKSVVLIVIIVLFVAAVASSALRSGSDVPSAEVNQVFDAQRFLVEDDGILRPMSEAEVIAEAGDPENSEDWSYSFGASEYPVRSLSYHDGNYVFEFYEDELARIQIFAPAFYSDKDTIPQMYNLSGGTVVTDTPTTYRVENCGVHDLWCTFGDEDGSISIAYISYTNFFDNPNDPVMEGDGAQLPDLQVLDFDSTSDGYFQYVTGHIANNSSKVYSYVQVEIGLYNGDTLVGSTMANVNNLSPGGVWEFKALVTVDNATQFRIEDVIGW